MVTELFKIALVTSLAGGALTLIISAAHPFTKRRFSAAWNYYVWLAVIFVMLCPMRISLPERAKSAVTPPRHAAVQTAQTADIADNTAAAPVTADMQAAPVRTARTSAVNDLRAAADKLNVLAYIWLITAAVLFAAKIISYTAFRRRLKKSSRIIDLPELAQYTKRRVTVRKSGSIISPLIVGVFRPILLLPETELTDEQLHYVLLHEAAHLNRNDILYKWLAAIVKCVHWFNPAAYFMAARVNTECEISCDLSVTNGMTRGEEIAYAQTILALLSNGKRGVPLTTGMTGGKRMLRRRFEMIKNKRDIGKRTRIISAALAVIMTASAALAGGVLADGVLDSGAVIEITNNGERVEFANKPFIENNTVYLPLRELLEREGITDIEYHNNGYVEFLIDAVPPVEYRGLEYDFWINRIQIGNPYAYFTGHSHGTTESAELLCAPILKEDTTYVPFDLFDKLKASGQGVFENMTVTVKNSGRALSGILYRNEDLNFKAALPLDWDGKYGILEEGNSIRFVQAATYEKYGAGTLCSVERVSPETADELLNTLGGSELLYSGENYAYIYETPTDVQYPIWADRDEEDAAIAAEYEEMFEQTGVIKDSFEIIAHIGTMLPFTDAEVTAARAVVEAYWRAKTAHDREAILKTVTEPNRADNMVYFSEGEKITLDDIRYDPFDPTRAEYITNGRGKVNGTRYEDVIVFRVDYTVEDKGYSAYSEGPYTDWSMILIRGQDGQWLIDDQGY